MDANGVRHLKRTDRTLKKIIERTGPCTLKPRKRYFVALCDAILSQQVSTKSADSTIRKFQGLFVRRRPTPSAVLQLNSRTLRSVGLSRQKSSYVRALADGFSDGRVPSRRLSGMNDEQVIDTLTQIKGIGVWTAQMFLIFVLNRPDVWPVGDLGVQTAAKKHYHFAELPTAIELTELAKPWRPYRSLASWYLWRSLSNAPMSKS